MTLNNGLIFIIGIALALLSAMKPAPAILLLPDTLLLYCLGLTLAVFGVSRLWREHWQKNNQVAQHLSALPSHDSGLQVLIETLQQLPPITADNLTQTQATLTYLHTQHVLPFQNFHSCFSQQDYAQSLHVITTFARGERLFNRIVSATLEGYVVEANAVLPAAIAAFEHAQEEIQLLFAEPQKAI